MENRRTCSYTPYPFSTINLYGMYNLYLPLMEMQNTEWKNDQKNSSLKLDTPFPLNLLATVLNNFILIAPQDGTEPFEIQIKRNVAVAAVYVPLCRP